MGILTSLIKEVFSASHQRGSAIAEKTVHLESEKSVLNVGGSSKTTPIPEYFTGWRHDLLDIDPRGEPDLLCDARELVHLEGDRYDAVYCSHNLEHYYRHEGISVLKGFLHILKSDGFSEIRVPDIAQVINAVSTKGLDLDDVLYNSAAGPISAHDVVYGLQSEIIGTGQDFYAHKTGFTTKSLTRALTDAGFDTVFIRTTEYLAIHALAFKTSPTVEQIKLLGPYWAVELVEST
jgi:hypothetical protein